MTLYSRSFSYSSCSVEKVSLEAGTYVLEVWGASGGTYSSSLALGGAGGYAKGTLKLREKTDVFVHVGSQGSDSVINSPGCNGGGGSTSGNTARSGGGATDIRLKTDSLYSRVIVAGGGGGTGDQSGEYGGFGGGEKGGDAGNSDQLFRAGKGAGQTSNTTTCADNSTTGCPKGCFGTGGTASGTYAGGGGGGWFGGSASSTEEGGGGGSGYVFTTSSFKPINFLLTEDFYLINTSLISGSTSFPKTDKSGNETGHRGNGYAIINQIEIIPTPSPTPDLPLPPEIPSVLDFSFEGEQETAPDVNDKNGKFLFTEPGNYISNVREGRYQFYANGSMCGQSIINEYELKFPHQMNISIMEDVKVFIDKSLFLYSPGHISHQEPFINPNSKVILNYTMSMFRCNRESYASLEVRYMLPSCHTIKHRRYFSPFHSFVFISMLLPE